MQHSLGLADIPHARDLPFADYAYPKSAWNGLVLVGEAPGAEEARLGRPFVGRSGQLLDKILEKAGIEREQTIIANVFRCQPPGNKVDHFFISRSKSAAQHIGIAEEFGKFGSTFCREAFAPDLRHLRETLKNLSLNTHRTDSPPLEGSVETQPAKPAAVCDSTRGGVHKALSYTPPLTPPSRGGESDLPFDKLDSLTRHQTLKVIIALGRTPLWALTGENGLLGKVGQFLPCRLIPSLQVMPTYHPSFILRGNWKLQDEWVGHFVAAKNIRD